MRCSVGAVFGPVRADVGLVFGPVSVRAGVVFEPVLVWAGAVFGPVSAGADRCWAVSVWVRAGVGQCRCGFRASVGAVLGSVGAVFILNGMIFSFLDEKRVFKGVV